jgi:glyoxylase-like metal-dependent hydrolase (beta-lactamase superfamily II)
MRIDLGGRIVWLRHLGRGNTTGDVVVHVPDAGVVITGDLLAHPVPYLAGGHPGELGATLRAIGRLDARVIVPGHGEIQYDRTFLDSVAEFVELVVAHVDREFFRLGTSWENVAAMQQSVESGIDLARWRRYFTGGHPENIAFFDHYSFPELVRAAFAVAWGR